MSRFWSSLTHDLKPYVPGEQPRIAELVKLNTNESPFGPSPRALEAIRAEAADTLRLYPDPQASALRAALATYHQVRPEQVFVGNGSDEVLAHAFAALLKHDAPLLFPDITYSFYPVYCRLFGIAYEAVPLDQAMQIRVADYRRPAGAIIVPNPNAPTGVALSRAEIADPAGRASRCARGDRRGLCRFRRRDRDPAGRLPPEPSGRADHVEVAGAGGLAGRLCDRRRRPDRGAHAGEGQLQLLSARPARPGRRHRLAGGRSLVSAEPRPRDRGKREIDARIEQAGLRSAALLRQLRLRAPLRHTKARRWPPRCANARSSSAIFPRRASPTICGSPSAPTGKSTGCCRPCRKFWQPITSSP